MSVISSLSDGLLLVTILATILLNIYAFKIARKYNRIADSFTLLTKSWTKLTAEFVVDYEGYKGTIVSEVEEFKKAIDAWNERLDSDIMDVKSKIDKQLEMPLSEHLYQTSMNILISLGASDMSGMGKDEIGKINMARNSFQMIGRMIGKGLKKEIPLIEQYGGNAEDKGGAGAMGGILEGMGLPPELGKLLGGMGGGKKKPAKPKAESVGGLPPLK